MDENNINNYKDLKESNATCFYGLFYNQGTFSLRTSM